MNGRKREGAYDREEAILAHDKGEYPPVSLVPGDAKQAGLPPLIEPSRAWPRNRNANPYSRFAKSASRTASLE